MLTARTYRKGHPDYYQDLAIRDRRRDEALFTPINSIIPNNPAAHEAHNWPGNMGGRLDETSMPSLPAWAPAAPITGPFNATSPKFPPKTEIVLADPKGSILADYIPDR